jgi:hypothetical protein
MSNNLFSLVNYSAQTESDVRHWFSECYDVCESGVGRCCVITSHPLPPHSIKEAADRRDAERRRVWWQRVCRGTGKTPVPHTHAHQQHPLQPNSVGAVLASPCRTKIESQVKKGLALYCILSRLLRFWSEGAEGAGRYSAPDDSASRQRKILVIVRLRHLRKRCRRVLRYHSAPSATALQKKGSSPQRY